MAAGREYLERLAAIDISVAAEIAAKYRTDQAPTLIPVRDASQQDGKPQLARVPANAVVPPPGAIPGFTRDGRPFRDALLADGLIGRVQEQRAAEVRAHIARLREILGHTKLAALEAWIREDVAPNVRSVTRATPVALPPTFRDPSNVFDVR